VGSDVAAFFDFDGTLIDGYSAAAFLKDRARRRDLPPGEFAKLLRAGLDVRSGKADFERFMRVGTQAFRGHDARTLGLLGDRLLRSTLGGLLFPEMLEIVEAHHRRGHTLVIASSALPFQVEPVARELGFDHVLCTRLETIGDLYTGRVDGPTLWSGTSRRAMGSRWIAAMRMAMGMRTPSFSRWSVIRVRSTRIPSSKLPRGARVGR